MWREMRCMAILFVQNRKKMACITRGWFSELESRRKLPRRQVRAACLSQQWQWRTFCTWLSDSALEPVSVHDIWPPEIQALTFDVLSD